MKTISVKKQLPPLLLFSLLAIGSIPARAQIKLKPLPVTLVVVPPVNWKFNAPQGDVIQSLVPAGFQGHIEAPKGLERDQQSSEIYEINVFAFAADPQLTAAQEIGAAFDTVYPKGLVAHSKISEVKRDNEDFVANRTIEVPYGNSSVTTLLHARVGKKTVVVIEAVVHGHAENNPGVVKINKVIPEITYSLRDN